MGDRIHEFFEACAQDNATLVTSLLTEGLNVNITDEEDSTGLQIAAANGSVGVVRTLVERGAALDKSNSAGWTPLLHAARHGHTTVIALLLQNQADVNACTDLGANAMMLAAYGGHLLTCRLLQDGNIDQTLVGSAVGRVSHSSCEFTPLMAAAHNGHDAVISHLLDGGRGDINYRTPSLGISALMLAALSGHMTTAQMLVERGADTNVTNINGQTPLAIAQARGQREVEGYLERKTTRRDRSAYKENKPDIVEATLQGDIDRISEILSVNISHRDACSQPDGATPLMVAAIANRIDIAELLVEAGCDVNKQDNVNGWTALLQAIMNGSKTVAMYLIERGGADVMIPAKSGFTAFDMVTLIDDIDTDLYRLLAARSVQRKAPFLVGGGGVGRGETGRGSSIARLTSSPSIDSTNGVNGRTVQYKSGGSQDDASGISINSSRRQKHAVSSSRYNVDAQPSLNEPVTVTEEQPKTNLKAWWSRMSNRFRNLKLGRTFNLTQLGPIPGGTGGAEMTADESICTTLEEEQDEHSVIHNSGTAAEPVLNLSNGHTRSSGSRGNGLILSETMLNTTRHSVLAPRHNKHNEATTTTLSNNKSTTSSYNMTGTIRPVVPVLNQPAMPPFLPPPAFNLDRSKMPPVSLRKSIASLGSTPSLGFSQPVSSNARLLQTQSTLNLASSQSRAPHSKVQFTTLHLNTGHSITSAGHHDKRTNHDSGKHSSSRTSGPGRRDKVAKPSSSSTRHSLLSSDATISRSLLEATRKSEVTVKADPMSVEINQASPSRTAKVVEASNSADINLGSSVMYRLTGDSVLCSGEVVWRPGEISEDSRGVTVSSADVIRSAEVSPSASSEASVLSSVMSAATSKQTSSSSTLTAGSQHENNNRHVSRGLHSSNKRSHSKDSASTLTPSPSPQIHPAVRHQHNYQLGGLQPTITTTNESKPSRDDEMYGILQKLSLEKYQPIFEEQEISRDCYVYSN